jgi:dihydrofolate reductase
MRPLIVTERITLDGIVEAPGGEPTHPHAGWTIPLGVPELYEFKLRETLEAESLLLGRKTYEGFRAAWPLQEGVFAEKMNAMPKHVVTSRREDLDWNSTALRGDVFAEARGQRVRWRSDTGRRERNPGRHAAFPGVGR